MHLCHKTIFGRSQFDSVIQRRCYRVSAHSGSCDEYPYLDHLAEVAPHLARKIRRDATMTTGAAWKSADAGPNRTPRWVALAKAEAATSPLIKAKLREKAASYEDCMEVAAKLTWSAYQMKNAPTPPAHLQEYLEGRFGSFDHDNTRCIVCRDYLDFNDFAAARRGRALIETAHANPRMHNAENVGFAHRECNIAQGGLSLTQFYAWIRAIIQRVDDGVSADVDAPGSHSSTSLLKDWR